MTIYKYPIDIKDVQTVTMPMNSKILTAQVQQGKLCLWAMVDEKNDRTEEHIIEVFGTGHPMINMPRNYIGTIQWMGGHLVFHVFERV